ncbi:MAG: hypothetical protein KGL39_03405 [Patescibacteria group bacterium]|nr:hypothetical protein [Patescibacteria group bacterium]
MRSSPMTPVNFAGGDVTQVFVLENRSALVSDAMIASYIPAWTTQLNDHLRAFWRSIPDFSITTGTVEQALTGGAWGVYFEDGISAKGDLGYHDIESGMPVLRIDCQAAQTYGYSVSEIGGHEFCETAVDPFVRNISRGPWGLALAEVCDLFVLPNTTYHIGGVEVPNFTTPAFWGLGSAPRLDMRGLLAPGQVFPYLPPGAYATVMAPGASAWSTLPNVNAELTPAELALVRHRSKESARCAVLCHQGAST